LPGAGLLLASCAAATRPVPITTPASQRLPDLVGTEKGKSLTATGTGKKGNRPRAAGTDKDWRHPIDRGLFLSFDKLLQTRNEMEKVSCLAFQVIWNFPPAHLSH